MFGVDNEKIVRLAFENQSDIYEGRVYLDYEKDEIFGVSMPPNAQPHPDDHLIEIYTLYAGENNTIDYGCDECPFVCGFDDEEERSAYPETKEECCLQAYIDNDFEDDYEDNYKEVVEERIRDVISDLIDEDLFKINEIRLEILDGYEYINELTNNNFVLDWYDELVDGVFDFGLATKEDLIQYIIDKVTYWWEYSEDEKLIQLKYLLEDRKYDEALELAKQ